MAEHWLTYSELGERLGVSPEAARQKVIRGRWRRQTGNDGRARVLLEEDVVALAKPRTPSVTVPSDDTRTDSRTTPEERPDETRTVDALEAHIASLREMLARGDRALEREREQVTEERRRADQERERYEAERQRTNELVTEIRTLVAERSRSTELTREVDELRTQLDRMARPWWRRWRAR